MRVPVVVHVYHLCVSKGTQARLLCVWHVGWHTPTGGCDKEEAGWGRPAQEQDQHLGRLFCFVTFSPLTHMCRHHRNLEDRGSVYSISVPPATPVGALKVPFYFSLRRKEGVWDREDGAGLDTTRFPFALCTCVCFSCVQKMERRSQKGKTGNRIRKRV